LLAELDGDSVRSTDLKTLLIGRLGPQYRPDRIGHGIKAWGDAELISRLRDENIPLEISVTSNWLTRSVSSVQAHPLPRLYASGVPVSINSDDPHLFDIDLVHEYVLCQEAFGFGEQEFSRINRLAAECSFL
jgi:adenosine deaminase